MAAVFQLEDLINITGNQFQLPERAVDVTPYDHVVLDVMVVKAATAGTLSIQDANTQSGERFTDISGATTVNLANTGSVKVRIDNPARFIRWSVAGLTGDASVMIDGVAR